MAKLIFPWTSKHCGPEGSAPLPAVFRDASARRELARLFDVLVNGERLAEDCARGQAGLTDDARARRYLLRQAAQERIHARVFATVRGMLVPGRRRARFESPAMAQYRAVVEAALAHHRLAESLVATQLVLESLGEVVLERLGAGMAAEGINFARLQRALLGQEQGHHAFGVRLVEHLLAQGRADQGRLEALGQDCLGLADALIEDLADVLDAFDEHAELYRASLRSRLPRWLVGGTACEQAVSR